MRILIRNTGIALLLIVLLGNPYSVDFMRQSWYDLSRHNSRVEKQTAIGEILSQFEQVKYTELDAVYLNRTLSAEPKYRKLLRQQVYYKVPSRELQRKIVGDIRIKAFVTPDDEYWKAIYGLKDVYWLIDQKLLTKMLEFQQELEKQQYDSRAFTIRYSHRHPQFNEAVNGVGNSQHILGKAVDIVIGDINRDGEYSVEDKRIVLDVLENTVIRAAGGVGRYPGTRTVHFDTRGYRARWDRQ
ncbi:MAG: D-Ala-D-Ala carboxypeptidase family metallohydrolase [Saprospiraceae bacterium]|nr:DUF882 domain-containing protein [Lewinella sp.]